MTSGVDAYSPSGGFCHRPGFQLLLSLLLSAALFATLPLVAPRLVRQVHVAAGGPGSVEAGWVRGEPVWVVTADDGSTTVLGAASPLPWFGMEAWVGWCEPLDGFSSFYDGSRFGLDGRYQFGPAPSGLPRYVVTARQGNNVVVGSAVASTGRGEGVATPLGECWLDPNRGDARRPPDVPDARYHAPADDGRDVVAGVVVVARDGGVFCQNLATVEPPSCGGAGMTVAGVRPHPDARTTAVVHARFLARRDRQGLRDVSVLPGGYTTFFFDAEQS